MLARTKANWTSPINSAGGTLQMRVQIRTQPGSHALLNLFSRVTHRFAATFDILACSVDRIASDQQADRQQHDDPNKCFHHHHLHKIALKNPSIGDNGCSVPNGSRLFLVGRWSGSDAMTRVVSDLRGNVVLRYPSIKSRRRSMIAALAREM
jgi:hypothetical protein